MGESPKGVAPLGARRTGYVELGEYATGMIRSTFMAVPARLPVLWAKVFVFAAVVLVLAIPATDHVGSVIPTVMVELRLP